MKKDLKKKILFCILLIVVPICVNAQRGCCSHHGGVAGCNENDRQICNDGSLSPSCTCTPTITYINGCTDSEAKNYNSKATKNDGTCQYYKYGCTDNKAINYSEDAEKDDGTCKYSNKKSSSAKKERSSNGVLSFLTIGGVGTGLYYYRKKRLNKKL